MSQKHKGTEILPEFDITITGRHMFVTDSMKDYAYDKIAKIEKFRTRFSNVAVTMDVQRELNRVDISLRVNNFRIKSHASTNDMYASIDMAVDKIQTQLRRYKDKLVHHHAKDLSEIDMNVNVLRRADEIMSINDDIDDENSRRRREEMRQHEVVATEKKKLKILTRDEAAMKLDLSGDQFLLFRNQEDMKLKLIYRRDDGDYCLMEPE